MMNSNNTKKNYLQGLVSMQIKYNKKFEKRTDEIVSFIWKDSPANAVKFYDGLLEAIEKITFMPYKHRKSTAFNNQQIRDLIFKNYVIPFYIDEENNSIEILSIYGRNLP